MRRNLAALALVAFAAVACDNDPIDPVTGGGGGGSETFTVVATDDPEPDDATLRGVVTGTLRVFLRNDAGVFVALGTANDVEVPLHEADTVRLTGLSRPPIDDYTAVRILFEGVDVEVLAGSAVGDSTLTDDAVLDVGSTGAATVDVLVPVFAVDNANVLEVVIDLNSEAWITRENLDALVVPQADLTNSVTVDVR